MLRMRDVFTLLMIVLPWSLLIFSSQRLVTFLPAVWLGTCAVHDSIEPAFWKEHTYSHCARWSNLIPTIYIITPTYSRSVQKAELTRLANTLLHVPNVHWIIVEDSLQKTELVTRFLLGTGLRYTHLNVKTKPPFAWKTKHGIPFSKGMLQRNLGLQWLRENFGYDGAIHQGVVYFADDDNTYSLELFEEMRSTKKVSVWPVAFVGGLLYESPKINMMDKVYGWQVKFAPSRPFAIDMAGFAINLQLILSKPRVYFMLSGAKEGHLESNLLQELVTLDDLEPKAANCTKVLVWHTKTMQPFLSNEDTQGFTDSNIEI